LCVCGGLSPAFDGIIPDNTGDTYTVVGEQLFSAPLCALRVRDSRTACSSSQKDSDSNLLLSVRL
jgi:hypothetical protein